MLEGSLEVPTLEGLVPFLSPGDACHEILPSAHAQHLVRSLREGRTQLYLTVSSLSLTEALLYSQASLSPLVVS